MVYRNPYDRFNNDKYDDNDYDAELPCASKESFRSERLAQDRLNMLISQGEFKRDDKPIRVYECLRFNDVPGGRLGCLRWHLTSRENW